MNKSTIITLLILLVILVLVGCFVMSLDDRKNERALETSQANTALTTGDASTPFTDFDGNTIDLTQYFGRVLIVTSWASWSPYSATELPMLAEVASGYAETDVVFIAINRGENKRTAEQFLSTIGMLGDIQLIVDADDRYYEAMGGYTMPETIVYDQVGDVVKHFRGTISSDNIKTELDTMLR